MASTRHRQNEQLAARLRTLQRALLKEKGHEDLNPHEAGLFLDGERINLHHAADDLERAIVVIKKEGGIR